MITYHAGDSLIRLKNAARARQKETVVSNTKFVVGLMEALKRAGIVRDVTKSEDGRTLNVSISYKHKEPVLLDLKLVSTPGLHIYKSTEELSKRKASTTLVLTTSKGILTHKEALKAGIGGEVIVEIE